MQKTQTILHISEVQMFVRRGDIIQRKPKKIVITVERCYVFWHPFKDNSPPAKPPPTLALNQFLPNALVPQMIQDLINKQGKVQQQRQFYSITGEPQYTIQLKNKTCKLVDDNHSILIHYLQKNNIQPCNIKNTILLINTQSRKIQFFFFETQQLAIMFVSAVRSVSIWHGFCKYCEDDHRPPNTNWALLLQKLIKNPYETIVIDPKEFLDGDDEDTQKEIFNFCKMLDFLPVMHGIQFKFQISQQYGYRCAEQILTNVQKFRNIRKLLLPGCKIDDTGIMQFVKASRQLSGLVQFNLNHNNLTDNSFQSLVQILNGASYLKKCDFSYNRFTIQSSVWFKDLLKNAHQYMILDFSYNQLNDNSVEAIQDAVLYSQNPPIQKIDFSHNKFTINGLIKLVIGDMMNRQSHPDTSVIVYPLLFLKDIFGEKAIDWQPTLKSQKYNPKALYQKQQQIIRQPLCIKITKINISGKKIPSTNKQIKKIQETIDDLKQAIKNDDLDIIYQITKEIKNSQFQFSITSLQSTHDYLLKKMNETLLFRNHRSINKVVDCARFVGLPLEKYDDRIKLVNQRKNQFIERLSRFLNFQMHQMELVTQIQEIVKEALRLNLGGPAIKTLYKLKLSKDKKVKQLIKQRWNPQVELRERRIQNYIKLYQFGVSFNEQIPLQLKQQQDINSNLFEVYIQANYFVLANIPKSQYSKIQSLLKTDQSTPKKFIQFILLARQRMQFITNEYYTQVSPNEFRISFQQLKINVCRLLWQYFNYQNTEVYQQLPNFPRKIPITPQKNIKIVSRNKFMKTYHIFKSELIKSEAKTFGLFQWKEPFTQNQDPEINEQIIKSYNNTAKMLNSLQVFKKGDIGQWLGDDLLKIIKDIRNSPYPQAMIEEMYIQIICFKTLGNQTIISNLCQIISFLTFYLRPPLSIDKQLVAFLAQQQFDFDDTSLSLTWTKIQQNAYVDRDWFPTNKVVVELIKNNGKLNIPITNPDKFTFFIQVPESSTVQVLFKKILVHQSLARFTDKTLFWIYKYNKTTDEQHIIMLQDYVGQIMSNFNEQTDLLIVRRRIYQPYYMVCYNKFKTSDTVLNSIYYEIKYFYLRGFAYRVQSDKTLDMAKLIAQVEIFDKNTESYQLQLKIYCDEIKSKILELFPATHINMSKAGKDKMAQNLEELSRFLIDGMKTKDSKFRDPILAKQKFIHTFRDYQFFCATNYRVKLKGNNDPRKRNDNIIAINSQFIYIEEMQATIFYQNILLLLPKQKDILISGYDKINQTTFEYELITNDHRASISIAMDILSYCTLRLLISNKFLYYQRELHEDLIVKNTLSISLFERQITVQKIAKKLLKGRHTDDMPMILELVKKIKKNLDQLQAMQLIAFKQKDIIHCQKTKYCKYQLQRNVFPFKKQIHKPSQTNSQTDTLQQGFDELQKQQSGYNQQQQQIDTRPKANTQKIPKNEQSASLLMTKRSQGPLTSDRYDRKEDGNQQGFLTFRNNDQKQQNKSELSIKDVVAEQSFSNYEQQVPTQKKARNEMQELD